MLNADVRPPQSKVQIDWKEVTATEEGEAVLAALSSARASDFEVELRGIDRVRRAQLPFYRYYQLVEVSRAMTSEEAERARRVLEEGKVASERDVEAAKSAPDQRPATLPAPADVDAEPRVFCHALVSLDEGDVILLDGGNGPIYGLNKTDAFDLSEANVVAYVAFFFSAVAGPYGLMPVIETLEAQSPDPSSGDLLADLAPQLREYVGPRLIPSPTGLEADFVVQAALLFQRAVFLTRIRVTWDGMVEVIEHEVAFASGASDDDAQAPEENEIATARDE